MTFDEQLERIADSLEKIARHFEKEDISRLIGGDDPIVSTEWFLENVYTEFQEEPMPLEEFARHVMKLRDEAAWKTLNPEKEEPPTD